MKRPLIGITADRMRDIPVGRDGLWNTYDYFSAVQHAGGMPVLLPNLATPTEAEALLDRLDGILFSGGPDVDPMQFGEQPHPMLGAIDPERDRTELLLARAVIKRAMPVLGICRGHQLLAVAFGGTLWQDIPSQRAGAIKHQHTPGTPKWYATHSVTVTPGTRLEQILGAEVRVNSRHHQAVKALPAGGWVESARSADGINEAMELPGERFCVSVQWHPENAWNQPDLNYNALFSAFVQAAQR